MYNAIEISDKEHACIVLTKIDSHDRHVIWLNQVKKIAKVLKEL